MIEVKLNGSKVGSGTAIDFEPGFGVTHDGHTATITSPVLTADVDVTRAELLAMYTTPVEIVPAVAGKTIMVDSVDFILIDVDGIKYVAGGVVGVQYKNTANGAGQLVHDDIAATIFTNQMATEHTKREPIDLDAIDIADLQGVGLYLSNKTAVFQIGTSTAQVVVRYHLVD